MKYSLHRHLSPLAVLTAIGIAMASPTFADDQKAGKKVFKKCTACHSLEEGKNKVGPSLYGIFGAAAGSVENYKYGKSLIAAKEKGLTWDEETLSGYLENPKKWLQAYLDNNKAKVKMAFKLKKEKQREQVINYFKSLNE